MKAERANASKIALCVLAGGIVMARHWPQAFVDILLAKVSLPTSGAFTRKPASVVGAVSEMQTRR